MFYNRLCLKRWIDEIRKPLGLILSKDCSFAITMNTTMGEKCPNTVFFWSEYSKIQARQNSVSGHFSHRAMVEKDENM